MSNQQPTDTELSPEQIQEIMQRNKAARATRYHELKDQLPLLRLEAEWACLTRDMKVAEAEHLQASIALMQMRNPPKPKSSAKTEPTFTDENSAVAKAEEVAGQMNNPDTEA